MQITVHCCIYNPDMDPINLRFSKNFKQDLHHAGHFTVEKSTNGGQTAS